ncbi:hypothetical protein TNCV_2224451 [Trichonephila clavipes]|nr:hypothetical protein TNCV_2224451 [Trichonephila clavipes]
MQVSKQWTDEHQTTRKTGSGRWKVTSVRDDQHLRTTSSRQLAARWSTTKSVPMSSLSIRRLLKHHGMRARLEVVPFLQGIPGTMFQQDNARPRVSKTVRDFCSAQRMQLLSWPGYSPNLSPIENVWDLIGRRLARDPSPSASKDELLLRI